MKRFSIILALLSLTLLSAYGKVVVIDIKMILNEAKSIKTIIVIGYRDSTMLYKFPNSLDTLTISCKVKQYSESNRQILIDKKMMSETDLAGKWPEIGQQVLIVISSKNKVSLFAIKTGDHYRFWDPNSGPFCNSFFWIPKEPPYKPLDSCEDSSKSMDANYWKCIDGCLVIALDIKERHTKQWLRGNPDLQPMQVLSPACFWLQPDATFNGEVKINSYSPVV